MDLKERIKEWKDTDELCDSKGLPDTEQSMFVRDLIAAYEAQAAIIEAVREELEAEKTYRHELHKEPWDSSNIVRDAEDIFDKAHAKVRKLMEELK